MATAWTIAIDWNRDGSYTDETANVLSANWFLGFQQPYMDVGSDAQLALAMRNADKRFTPENRTGPLYGKLAPLRPVKIESNDGATTRRHFSGWVQSIHPTANRNGERAAVIQVNGAMQFLKATETKIELQENQRSDQIINTLIKEVIFPPALSAAWVIGDEHFSRAGQSTYLTELNAYSSFEQGKLNLNMAGDNWVRQGGYADQTQDTFDVYRSIRDITAAERGKFFFDREGKAVFWNRHHILDKDTPDATLNDVMTGMDYTFASPDQTKNEIIVTCHPRSIDDRPTTLWELKDAIIRVAPNQTREVYVKYKDEKDKRIGGKDVTVEDVEYLQGSCMVTVESKANGANLIFKNESETTEAVVEKCAVKGRKIVDEGQMDASAKDQQSITYYGRRTMNINLPSIDDLDQAQHIADFECSRRKTPFGLAQSITLQSHAEHGGHQHAHQLALTIGSLLRLQETQTGHDGSCFIIGEAHELSGAGKRWKTTWYLEPQIETLPWQLGDATRSQIGSSAYLAY